MSNLLVASQTARKAKVGDLIVEFPRLQISDLAIISADIVAERKARAKAIAKEANYLFSEKTTGVGPFELFSIIQEIEDKVPTVSELYNRASTPGGALSTLKVSLKKSGKSDTDINLILSLIETAEIVDIAQDLITCSRVPAPDFTKAPEQKVTGSEPVTSDDTKKDQSESAGFGDSAN